MNTSDMHTRAMLANLSISAWSATKFDRQVTEDTNNAHGASSDAGRYNKALMPKDMQSSYKALTKFIGNLRTVHYEKTLPWSDTGWRLLPVKAYSEYVDLMRKAQHEFNSLLDTFVHDYPSLRDMAKSKLNGMFKEDDYPANVRNRYSFGIDFSPVPVGTDFRVTLAQSEIDMIAARTEERVKSAFKLAMRNGKDGAVDRLEKVVAAIVERLTTIDECSNCKGTGFAIETRKNSDKGQNVVCWYCNGTAKTDATFRDSLITNARDICDALTVLNVTDDPVLESLRCKTELLATTSPETLRVDSTVREDTAKQAQNILDAITASFGK